MRGALQGKFVVHDARQTPMHDARWQKAPVQDARELNQAIHVCMSPWLVSVVYWKNNNIKIDFFLEKNQTF